MIKIRTLSIVAIFILGAVSTGCAVNTASDIVFQGEDHVFEKNYIVNEKRTIYIGESIVKIKDYYVKRKGRPFLIPAESFTFDAVLSVRLQKGEAYKSAGLVFVNNKRHTVVDVNKEFLGSKLAILVGEDGSISPYTATITDRGIYVNKYANASITPSNAKMTREFDDIVNQKKGYINYELIFNGVDKNTLTVTYREYTPDNLARTAFFQTLTYRDDAKVIRYKRLKIGVHRVDGESMTYSVLEEPPEYALINK